MANMGTLAVKLEAKTAEFKRRMIDAKKTVEGSAKDIGKATDDIADGLTDAAREAGIYRDSLGKLREANGKFVKSERMAELGIKNWNKAAGKADKTNRKLIGSLGDLRGGISKVSGILGLSAGGLAASVLAATNNLVNTGREVENFARLTNTSTRDFQELAIGARRFGFESDKVADILKDMNDRVGDFIQTGGGPMADFFENVAPKVGVTADQFRNLSGKDALQLYVSSLEKANLSQADMTFYMEAIASDSTALLPLLQGNGRALKEIGDEAERTGQILSDLDLQKLRELDASMREIKGSIEGVKNEVLLGAVPAFQEFADELNQPETVRNMQTLAEAAAQIAKWTVQAAGAMADFGGKLGQEIGVITQGIGGLDLEEQRGRILNALENPSERLRFFGPGGIVEYFDEAELRAELDRINGLIELQKKAQSVAAPPVVAPPQTSPEAQELSDKQLSLINTMTAKIEELEQRILSGENAIPLQERIKELKQQIEETKNATKDGKKPTEDNTNATKDNTEALKTLGNSLKGGKESTEKDPLRETTAGGKDSAAFDMLIKRFRTIAGTGQQGPRAAESFERAARTIIAQAEGAGGYDTERMREQMESMLSRLGETSKTGMIEAARELTGGQGANNIGSITINLKSDSGETSGEVSGDSAFLQKLASSLQSVSTAV